MVTFSLIPIGSGWILAGLGWFGQARWVWSGKPGFIIDDRTALGFMLTFMKEYPSTSHNIFEYFFSFLICLLHICLLQAGTLVPLSKKYIYIYNAYYCFYLSLKLATTSALFVNPRL
jgi:hypothetical protein